ncbi:MAG: hypothetical protein FJ137_15075 [Deltaproteobacteria bacterium]|nr:hypothetical protein [Deltaproteobacteria bacterium]
MRDGPSIRRLARWFGLAGLLTFVVPAHAADDELEAFHRKEEPAFVDYATKKAWTKMIERAADMLVKVPGDPFALGWAGFALANLGYSETGAALIRRGAAVIQAPVFQKEVAAPTLYRDTTVIVRANGAPLESREALQLRQTLQSWVGLLLRDPEPLAKSIDSNTLRVVAGFLGELRTSGIQPAPEVSFKLEDGALFLFVRGHSSARRFPPLELVKTDGRFARFVTDSSFVVEAPAVMELRLERFADFSVAGAFARACERSAATAVAALAATDEAELLRVAMPDWPAGVTAEYHGCVLQGAGGAIRLPYLDWPDGKVTMRFGDNTIVMPSPGRPGRGLLTPAKYSWMKGELVLNHVPADFVATISTGSRPRITGRLGCSWHDNVGRCTAPTGDFVVDVAAPGRRVVQVKGHMRAKDAQKVEVRLEKASLIEPTAWDAVALGVAGAGAVIVGAAFVSVASARDNLKNEPGVIPAGKAQDARALETIATVMVAVGSGVFIAGVGTEVALLAADAIESKHLPEWE